MVPFADSIEVLKYFPVFCENHYSIRESLEYCLPYSIWVLSFLEEQSICRVWEYLHFLISAFEGPFFYIEERKEIQFHSESFVPIL